MVNTQLYDPSNIFKDESNPIGLAGTGKANIALAASFYHSRKPKCESQQCKHVRYNEFDRNAGAIQLYKEDGINTYEISEEFNNKEYHCISYGNKQFKKYTKRRQGTKTSSYGHSERMLMRDILDDLIKVKKPDGLKAPSENFISSVGDEREYEILKYLTENANKYKEFLESENIIVKMWSERPPCTDEPGIVGGGCSTFIENICPEGSQFGFIIEDYERSDNGGYKVINTFKKFTEAYENHLTRRKRKYSE